MTFLEPWIAFKLQKHSLSKKLPIQPHPSKVQFRWLAHAQNSIESTTRQMMLGWKEGGNCNSSTQMPQCWVITSLRTKTKQTNFAVWKIFCSWQTVWPSRMTRLNKISEFGFCSFFPQKSKPAFCGNRTTAEKGEGDFNFFRWILSFAKEANWFPANCVSLCSSMWRRQTSSSTNCCSKRRKRQTHREKETDFSQREILLLLDTPTENFSWSTQQQRTLRITQELSHRPTIHIFRGAQNAVGFESHRVCGPVYCKAPSTPDARREEMEPGPILTHTMLGMCTVYCCCVQWDSRDLP